MDAFSSEFAKYWLAGQGEPAGETGVSGQVDDAQAASQREAFEALADRVVAARSIV